MMISCLLLLVACQPGSAFKYSQDIVAKERSMLKDIEHTESEVLKLINAGKFKEITPVAEKMEGIVESRLQEIRSTPPPRAKGAEEFQQAAIEYFSYIKSVYTAYKEIGMANSDTARNDAYERLQKIAAGNTDAVKKLQTVQRKFASANGFRVQ